MGWAYCGQIGVRVPKQGDPKGSIEKREIGYGIEATCDKRGCGEVIFRGLSSVCGEMHHGPFDDEPGCGRYYCGKHQGWYAERGRSCSHRGKFAWGKTFCQTLHVPASGSPLYPGLVIDPAKVYCACLEDHPVEWPPAEVMAEIRERLSAFYPAIEDQDKWLNTRHPLLGDSQLLGQSPLERIERGDSGMVHALIDQLDSGAVV